ncbi:hypothetical protein JAAARDRAFT_48074 [Jaapia argillacea MUCL 33604]|uniref:Restriction of telomere capping protein 4 n=1 Tax=Jaapia argillacea MUCL 33604 TaxID=933084 RepID=A0A067PPQ7_9AGAM|nr:hypothetical protein JAAARDRAFT_48074 [Jaapia argillacea MUCL 33604]
MSYEGKHTVFRTAVASAPSQPLTTSSKTHATPIAMMWQTVGERWLDSAREASSAKDKIVGWKQRAMVFDTTLRTQAGQQPITIPCPVEAFPDFCLEHDEILVNAFQLTNDTKFLEAYVDGTWELHSCTTSRRLVSTDEPLLYQALPDGIQGSRILDSECPTFDTLWRRQRGKGRLGEAEPMVPLGAPKQWARSSKLSDAEGLANERPQKRLRSGPIIDLTYSTSDDDDDDNMSQPGVDVLRKENTLKGPKVEQDPHTSLLQSFSRNGRGRGRGPSQKGAKSGRRKVSQIDGGKLWPTAYEAKDVIAGFKTMEIQLTERPKPSLEVLFTQTFNRPFIRSTFTRHWSLYQRFSRRHLNTIQQLEHTPVGSENSLWPSFVAVAEAEMDGSGNQYDRDEDEEDEDGNENDEDPSDAKRFCRAGNGDVGHANPSNVAPSSKRIVSDPSSSSSDNDSASESDDAAMVIDARFLCPYCDEIYPTNPSRCLKCLHRTTDSKSQPAPFAALGCRNKYHRITIPATAATEHCERHRFETRLIHKAIQAGWPRKINFEALQHRIVSLLKPTLGPIVDNPCQSSLFLQLVAKARKHGSMHTFGANVPGKSFIGRVLVPEVAIHLIETDLQISWKNAIQTKKESDSYGYLAFPDNGSDNDDDDDETPSIPSISSVPSVPSFQQQPVKRKGLTPPLFMASGMKDDAIEID